MEPTPTPNPTTTETANAPATTANIDPFLLVVLAGIGLVGLGQIITLFTVIGDLPSEAVAPALLGTFGALAVGVGLALAGALRSDLPAGGRVAMLIAGAYFTTNGGLGTIIGSMFAGFSSFF